MTNKNPDANESENIDPMIEALAKAQSEMEVPMKTSTVQFKQTKFKFAPLVEVNRVIRGPLANNGFALTQTFVNHAGHTELLTTLRHSSGGKIQSTLPIALSADPRTTGSTITYMRRYSICSLLNLAADDDDGGQAAMKENSEPAHESHKITSEEADQLRKLLIESNTPFERFGAAYGGISTIEELHYSAFDDAMEKLLAKKAKMEAAAKTDSDVTASNPVAIPPMISVKASDPQ